MSKKQNINFEPPDPNSFLSATKQRMQGGKSYARTTSAGNCAPFKTLLLILSFCFLSALRSKSRFKAPDSEAPNFTTN